LKILRGNPGRRPLPTDEPRPDRAIPDAPDFLSAEALKEWDRLTVELDAVGLLTNLDRAALAAYCQAYGRWLLAERMVANMGTLLTSKRTGVLYQNPYLGVANRAQEQLRHLGPLFGLDPSSRGRLKVSPPEPEEDPLDQLEKRAKGSA
jgi:P27 family predicted phage terminase small subunit